MKLLTMIKKLHQTPRLQLAIVILLIAVSALGWLFLKRGESNDRPMSASTASQDKSAGASELAQKEIEDLLDIEGKFFIELAKFKAENAGESTKLGLYQKYDGSIREVWRRIDEAVYNRFVLESWYQKDVVGSNGEIEFYKGQYFRAVVGPFEPQQAETELKNLVNSGFKDATIRQVIKDDELRPSITHQLLFLYTRNKGPRFISGWLYYWFGYIEYVIDTRGKRILFHSLNTYRGDRNGGRLFLADGNTGTISNPLDFSQGFVLLPDTEKALVQKSFSVETKEPLDYFEGMRSSASLIRKLDKADLDRVAKEIGVAANQVQIQVVSEKPVATVSVLFELDLRTGESKSLKLFGGFGGIFRLKDGAIYLSNNYTTAFYRGLIDMKETLGIFGYRPYQLLDLKRKRLVNMPDDFQPDSSEVIQPRIGRQSEEFTIIAETGVVRLVCFKDRFFLQH